MGTRWGGARADVRAAAAGNAAGERLLRPAFIAGEYGVLPPAAAAPLFVLPLKGDAELLGRADAFDVEAGR